MRFKLRSVFLFKLLITRMHSFIQWLGRLHHYLNALPTPLTSVGAPILSFWHYLVGAPTRFRVSGVPNNSDRSPYKWMKQTDTLLSSNEEMSPCRRPLPSALYFIIGLWWKEVEGRGGRTWGYECIGMYCRYVFTLTSGPCSLPPLLDSLSHLPVFLLYFLILSFWYVSYITFLLII